jgi:hypothetical protein
MIRNEGKEINRTDPKYKEPVMKCCWSLTLSHTFWKAEKYMVGFVIQPHMK